MKRICLIACIVVVLQPGALVASAASTELLRDPMQPPPLALRKMRAAEASSKPKPAKKTEVIPPPPLVLQSIIFSSSRQIAIINDLPVVSGEQVEGARVISIQKDRVTLVRRGKKLELMLDSDSRAINKTKPKSKL